MTVLVSNRTPYSIWKIGGSLVGACRTINEAHDLIVALKRSFPASNYICKDPDGDIRHDSRSWDTSSVSRPHGETR